MHSTTISEDPSQPILATATRAFQAFSSGWATGDYGAYLLMLADSFEFSYPTGEDRGVFTGAAGKARMIAKCERHAARGERLRLSAPVRVGVAGNAVFFEFDSDGQFGAHRYHGHNLIVLTVEGARITGFREFFGDLDPAMFGG